MATCNYLAEEQKLLSQVDHWDSKAANLERSKECLLKKSEN